jgi:uroporphyrin-III C-methyltransferase
MGHRIRVLGSTIEIPRSLEGGPLTGPKDAMAGSFTLPGKVFLIGAGPGSADLLTVRAANILRRAEVVLHDGLVSAEVLELAPANAFVQNVGKRCGEKTITQEEIHQKMVALARQGRAVVRLKIGDPLIFGRAQEEIDALRAAGIDFEIVPGVTAALAAAAEARISLTNRKGASKLVFLSNHHGSEKPVAIRSSDFTEDATLAVYMPGSEFGPLVADLMEDGMPLDTPCLLVSNATRKEQKIYQSSLKDLPAAPSMASPSLLLIGELAKVREAYEGMVLQTEATLDLAAANSDSSEVLQIGDEENDEVATLAEGKDTPQP